MFAIIAIYRREIFDKRIYLMEMEIGNLMSLPPGYFDHMDVDQVILFFKNSSAGKKKSMTEQNITESSKLQNERDNLIISKYQKGSRFSIVLQKFVHLFWQKLEFNDPQMELKFKEWRNKRFLAYTRMNFAINIILAIMHSFLDIVSFCQEGAFRQSFILCNNVDSANYNSGIYLRNQRLIVIIVTLSFGLLFMHLPWLKNRPDANQWFVAFISTAVGVYWR